MTGVCNINGVIGEMFDDNGQAITPFVTFKDVAAQVERQKGITQLDVFITTRGGLVEEGNDIVDYLENLKTKGIIVNTHAEKMVYSFGADIFLVGQQRFIGADCKFMIHNPWATLTEGDADRIDAYAKELRKLENVSLDSYSTKTGTSKEALKTLMKKDTFLTPEEAVHFNFATSISEAIELKAVAFSRKFNPNQNEMSKEALSKKDAETLLEKLANNIKQFLNPKQVKMLLDATGDIEVTFDELEADDTPSDGDVAKVDGKLASEDITMPNGDVYTFPEGDGVLVIVPKEAGSEDDAPEVAELQTEVAQLKKDAVKKDAKIKALQKEKGELETTVSGNADLLKTIQKDMKQLKKSISSDFASEEEDGNEGKGSGKGKPKSRQLFKPKK